MDLQDRWELRLKNEKEDQKDIKLIEKKDKEKTLIEKSLDLIKETSPQNLMNLLIYQLELISNNQKVVILI